MKQILSIATLFLCVVLNAIAFEAISIEIKDHKFIPEEISVPVNQKVKLVITNSDTSAEEFESHDLHREKIIQGNSQAVIYIGPLKPGTYSFFGEFNPKTAIGRIIVK